MSLRSKKGSLKIMLVAGARPNFIKVAPLIRAIRLYNKRVTKKGRFINYRLVHTGQHYDDKMSAIFFGELGIPPPLRNLQVGSDTHARQTAKIMIEFEPLCVLNKPEWIVVFGDVNSTLACTLVAAKLGIKVAHVEAGLRSFDRTMPEEINRVVTDALADLLLTPSPDANRNLKNEGIVSSKIQFVGNIMIDTLVASLEKVGKTKLPKQLTIKPKEFIYITLHRPSNVDDPINLRIIMRELSSLANRFPVIFPVHPRTLRRLRQYSIAADNNPNLKLIEPIGYHDSLWLTQNATFVLTDSGGLQEESTYFRTPCLTLRPNTERPITIKKGTNKLTTIYDLRKDIERIISGRKRRGQIPRLWDGRTAERILKLLLQDELS